MIRLAGLVMSVASACFAQAPEPCFAFLLKGDVSVTCEGTRTQITRRGDVDQFAVSNEQSVLGYITSTMTGRNPATAVEVDKTTLVDLRSGIIRQLVGDNFLISTCGGLFWGYDAQRNHSGTRELITGTEVVAPPYIWFRCSSDRRVVVGTTSESGGDLYEGVPPGRKIAVTGSFYPGTFNISPNGSEVAYFTDRSPVCVASSSGMQCADRPAALPNGPSVDDSGQVLFTVSTPQQCFYKTASNFSPERFTDATEGDADACLAIGCWRPGLKSVDVIEPLGRNPQWISPVIAKQLRGWAAHSAAGRRGQDSPAK
jgi:hypothetical protein